MSLKLLAKQTAIYGLSTIIIRFANWILTPYYSRMIEDKVAIGVYTILMAIVALINILYMLGMETSFFRFAKDDDTIKVYQTTQSTVFFNGILLSSIIFLTASPICGFLKIPGKEIYIYLIATTLFFENICNIPFARLRFDSKPLRFSIIKGMNIVINILLNILFISYYYVHGIPLFELDSSDPLTLILIANLIPWIVTAAYFSKDIISGINVPDRNLLKKILNYSYPLILVGIAGMVNETLDRYMLDRFLTGTLEENRAQIAIYGVNFKLAIILVLAIQAFRMGAEPYFFNQSKQTNSKKSYAVIMDFFIIACCTIMVVTNLNREFIGLINESSYKEGLFILPILLLAKLFLGIYYNASIWFKLTDNTIKGAVITAIGAGITILMNYLLIPTIGYLGSAYATLGCYASMAIICILWGQRYFPVPYHFIYNTGWILGSIMYSYFVFHFLQGYFVLLIIASILFVLIASYLAFYRWKVAKSILA